MNNDVRSFIVSEVQGIISSIAKDKIDHGGYPDDDVINATNEVSDVLFNEGYIQHKMMDIYKKYSIADTEVSILRLNKYINKLYTENESKILEERENSIKIPDHPMNQWLAELIEEDLFTGVAPFENTLLNVRKIHDIALNYDPLFDAINYELQGLYKHIKDNRLINPIIFDDDTTIKENTEDISFGNITEDTNEVEYISSPFTIIDN